MRLQNALLVSVVAVTLVHGQAFGAVASELGNSQRLQGQQQVLPPFILTVITNETHALVAINISHSMSAVGWAAVGFGSQMSNADMYIIWPNNDATWTCALGGPRISALVSDFASSASHRNAGGHVMPQPVSPQPSTTDFLPVDTLTTDRSSSPYASFAFLRPLTYSSDYATASSLATLARAPGQQLIYAYSSHNPGSLSETASLTQHDQGAYGPLTMDLSQSFTSGSVIQSGTQTGAWTRYDSMVVLHALCGCFAWLLFAPAAVLVGRLGRNVQGWFRMHQLLQSLLTSTMTIAAVALGGVAVNEAGDGHFDDIHKIMGLLILILLGAQIFLGSYVHRLFAANRSRRPATNVVHILLGVLLIILGYAQVFKGFNEFDRAIPGWAVALATLSLAAFLICYVVSCLRLVQARHERGYNWSFAAFGLGRVNPIALSDLHVLDPFAQPPPPPRSPRLADMTTHDRQHSVPDEAKPGRLPISELYSSPRSGWVSFSNAESELPWQSNTESRISRPHYAAMDGRGEAM